MARRRDSPFVFSTPVEGASPVSIFSDSSVKSTHSEKHIREVYNGELAELASHADVVKSLECPVCREIALSPIYTCENGHIVCYTCRRRLLVCALCKVQFSKIRNYGLESIIAKSKFHCHYKEFGCPEILMGELLNEHVRTCPFKRPEKEQPNPSSSPECVQWGSFPLHLGFQSDNNSLNGSTWNISISDESDGYTQTMAWVRASRGSIPENGVMAGFNSRGSPIYVCRAFHQQSCAPGMICPNDRFAYINWFGTRSKYYYEVLVAIPQTTSWVTLRDAEIPENAIIGADQHGFERLYIGRSKIDNCWVTGYIKPSHRRCYISNGQTALARRFYQILVTRSS